MSSMPCNTLARTSLLIERAPYDERWHPPSEAGRVPRKPEHESSEAKSHEQVAAALHRVFPVKDEAIVKMPHLPSGERAHYSGFTPGFAMNRVTPAGKQRKLSTENPHRVAEPKDALDRSMHQRNKEEWLAHVKDAHKNVHDIVRKVTTAMADPHHSVTKQWLEGKSLGSKGRTLNKTGSLLDHHLKYAADSGETQTQLNLDPSKKSARTQARKYLTHISDRLRYEYGLNLHHVGREHESRHQSTGHVIAADCQSTQPSLLERVMVAA